MANRKLPFGYHMIMGEIVPHPQEAEIVKYIFDQYNLGASFNTLVSELREQEILYDAEKLWNKNMIARMLEDRRYAGERGYPTLINPDTLERASEKRMAKQVLSQKTEAQKLLRRLSSQTATMRMEKQVLDMLNGLIRNPERIQCPTGTSPASAKAMGLQEELNTAMGCQPIDEAEAQKLILSIAATQYSAIGSREYETVRIRKILAQRQPMTELDAQLLQAMVSAIQVYSDGALDIRLRNDQIIGVSKHERASPKGDHHPRKTGSRKAADRPTPASGGRLLPCFHG